MEALTRFAENFIGAFNEGGQNLIGMVSGILPTLLVLMTAVNAVVMIIGEDRVTNFAQKLTKNTILRYTVFPVFAVFFLTNPMCYTFGKFVEEEQKPAFYDATVSFLHPVTGLFPHANAGELFVFTGISAGITQLGLSIAPLALRYFVAGIIIILIRGIITERITKILIKQRGGQS